MCDKKKAQIHESSGHHLPLLETCIGLYFTRISTGLFTVYVLYVRSFDISLHHRMHCPHTGVIVSAYAIYQGPTCLYFNLPGSFFLFMRCGAMAATLLRSCGDFSYSLNELC